MKRLAALIAGALGLRALLRRRAQAGPPPSADDLRAKLAESRSVEEDRADFEAGETPVDQVVVADVDSRRADVHARARKAIDELGRDES